MEAFLRCGGRKGSGTGLHAALQLGCPCPVIGMWCEGPRQPACNRTMRSGRFGRVTAA